MYNRNIFELILAELVMLRVSLKYVNDTLFPPSRRGEHDLDKKAIIVRGINRLQNFQFINLKI